MTAEGISSGLSEEGTPVCSLRQGRCQRSFDSGRISDTSDVVVEVPPLHTAASADGEPSTLAEKPWSTQEIKRKELPFEISVKW